MRVLINLAWSVVIFVQYSHTILYYKSRKVLEKMEQKTFTMLIFLILEREREEQEEKCEAV